MKPEELVNKEAHIKFQMGVIYWKTGRFEEAITQYLEALEILHMLQMQYNDSNYYMDQTNMITGALCTLTIEERFYNSEDSFTYAGEGVDHIEDA